jgi:hypothetical protein
MIACLHQRQASPHNLQSINELLNDLTVHRNQLLTIPPSVCRMQLQDPVPRILGRPMSSIAGPLALGGAYATFQEQRAAKYISFGTFFFKIGETVRRLEPSGSCWHRDICLDYNIKVVDRMSLMARFASDSSWWQVVGRVWKDHEHRRCDSNASFGLSKACRSRGGSSASRHA